MTGTYFNIQIANNSTFDASDIYITAFGFAFDPNVSGPPYNSTDQSFISFDADGYGTLVTPTPSTSGTAYSYPLDTFTPSNSMYNIYLPPCSGRVYISIGSGLCLSFDADNCPITISDPQYTVPSDPNYQILYDKFEFNCNPESTSPAITANVSIDTTAVDFFGLPLSVTMNNQTLGVTQSLTDMQNILQNGNGSQTNGLSAYPGQWSVLPLTGSNQTILRVMSPNEAPGFPSNYLDDYIASLWTYYAKQGNTITIDVTLGTNTTTYTGSIDTTTSLLSFSSGGGAAITFPQPTSNEVFGCAGITHPQWTPANDTPQGVIVSVLTAAMNLGILPVASSVTLTADFADDDGLPTYYTNVQNSTPYYNLYSALLHSTGDALYAFAFDDVAGESDLLQSSDTSTVATITLNSLEGITLPPLTSSETYDVTFVAGFGESGSVELAGTTYSFANPATPTAPVSVTVSGLPSSFQVAYGAGSYTINMVTQSACPFTGVVFSAVSGGTQIAWPGAPAPDEKP